MSPRILLAALVAVLLGTTANALIFPRLRNFTTGGNSVSRATLAKKLGTREQTLGVCTSNLAFLNLGNDAIPAAFNADTHWASCVPRVFNQGECGSCWAFAVTGVMAQRMCIAGTNITSDLRLSPQDVISCDTSCSTTSGTSCTKGQAGCMCQAGCSGGYPDLSFRFMSITPVTAEHCAPYEAGDGSDPNTCADIEAKVDTCNLDNPTDSKTFTAGQCYYLKSIADMQRDIMKNGPIQAAFSVYEDFYSYSSGVYTSPSGESSVGGHAIIIVGWGVESGQEYWLCRNSWSDGWGDNGYFKMARGSNECGIESYASAAVPVVENVAFSSEFHSAGSTAAPLLSACLLFALLALLVL